MNRLPKVSIVIPALNEEPVIGNVVKRVAEVMESHRYPFEILVIDDGSEDGTARAASIAGAKVIRHPYNLGNGAAVKRGIREAEGDAIVLMDGDGQHDPADIPRLLEYWPEYVMVVGARNNLSESELHRDLANKFYNLLASYIAGRKVEDLTSGFRLIDAGIAKKVAYLFPNGFSYPSTATIALFRSGHCVKYIPIKASARVGKSKIRLLRDGLKFLLIIARVGTLFTPLKLFIPLGSLMFLPGVSYAIYRLLIGKAWTLPIVISITAGLLILVLSLISEQIALLRLGKFER